MQEYDVALKLPLKGSASLIVRELTGTAVAKWYPYHSAVGAGTFAYIFLARP